MATNREPEPVEVTVVVPAFREQRRIARSLERLEGWLRRNRPDHEIIVVDDGSPDRTAEVVRAWADGNDRRRMVGYARNRGKGFAVRTGLALAQGRYVFFTDADLSTPPEEIDRAIALLAEADMVAGSRAAPDSHIVVRQSSRREGMGRLFNRLASWLGVAWMPDTQCGFKGFRREALAPLLEESRVDGFAFDVELLVLARRHGLRVRELPVTWRNDPESHVRVVPDSLRMLLDLFSIARRARRRS